MADNVLGTLFGDIANAIRGKTGETETMKPAEFPEKISGITTGGGSSDDVRYVTFMSYDGTVEHGKKAVAVGDDCADPIARGVFDTPTRESDVQYNYTFAGWATEANGGLNSDALKAVTEDRTVYANFAAVVRYYTISFYDGETLLESKSIAYGETPVVSNPVKSGFSFDGWEPEITAVTGDITYTAIWKEMITFAGGTWADIIRISESGEASKYFALGETREFSFIDANGVSRTTSLVIVGFDKDTLADGSGTAGMTLVSTSAEFMMPMHTASDNSYPGWTGCDARAKLQNMMTKFPSELQAGLKTVRKSTRKYVDGTDATGLETSEDKIWIPSLGETGWTYTNANYGLAGEASLGYSYMPSCFEDSTYGDDCAQDIFWTRSARYTGKYDCAYRMNNNSRSFGSTYPGSTLIGIIFGICI